MSNIQCPDNHNPPNRKPAVLHLQTVDPYMALVVTADPEHEGKSSSSGTPSSPGSSALLFACNGANKLPETPPRSRTQDHSNSGTPQPDIYSSPKRARAHNFSVNSTPTRTNYAVRAAGLGTRPAAGLCTPISSVTHAANLTSNDRTLQASSLAGVPESVAVQEMAFRQGQRDSCKPSRDAPAHPFARQFDKLWSAFYELGKECGVQRVPTPVNMTQQNFTWPVLINPYTQSLENPGGSLDPEWSRKMIQAALSCMEELIRVTCRRNTGWDKTVVDIPLPAQEALVAFPDLAQYYEQLKRDAKEARAGGRPYGY